MKASELKEGHVLIDPEGHLYEVVALIRNLPDVIYAWLWPDSSSVPNFFQVFEPEEDIIGINASTVDLMAEVNLDEPNEGGVAE